MNMNRWPKTALVAAVIAASLLAQGCAANSTIFRDPRDAPWDPPAGRSLFEQIPAWDGAAGRICGGHLTEEERRRTGKSPRC